MSRYVVSFTCTTGFDVWVEADDEAAAIAAAEAIRDEKGPGDLPEIWAEDFVLDGVKVLP